MISPNLRATRWLTTEEGRLALMDARQKLPLQAKDLLRLRSHWGAEKANELAAFTATLEPAETKFRTAGVLATDRGLQQSSHIDIARYKASHIPTGSRIIDICCGIGGDSVAFHERGKIIAVDRDPSICAIAAHNLKIASSHHSGRSTAVVIAQPAEQFFEHLPGQLDNTWLHIDPDRRPSGKRVSDPNYCEPEAERIAAWMERFEGAIIKLSPAAQIPNTFKNVARREWISHEGQCRQQLVWTLMSSQTTNPETKATRITGDGRAHSFLILDDPAEHDRNIQKTDKPSKIIYDFDPAVRAAGLSAALANETGLTCIHSPAGFFTSDHLPFASRSQDCPTTNLSSLITAFEIIWLGSFDEKKLKHQIRELEPTTLEIKVRGLPVTPEQIRPRVMSKPFAKKASKQNPLTLLIAKGYAAIARRIDSSVVTESMH